MMPTLDDGTDFDAELTVTMYVLDCVLLNTAVIVFVLTRAVTVLKILVLDVTVLLYDTAVIILDLAVDLLGSFIADFMVDLDAGTVVGSVSVDLTMISVET